MDFALLPSTAPTQPTPARRRNDRSRFAFDLGSRTFQASHVAPKEESEWAFETVSFTDWLGLDDEPSEETQPALSSPIFDALAKLRSYGRYGANWDGEGGRKPSSEAIDVASKLLGAIADVSAVVPSVGLAPDGSPMFVFLDGQLDGEIIVHRSGAIEYCFNGDDAPCDEFVFSGGTLPDGLVDYLNRS